MANEHPGLAVAVLKKALAIDPNHRAALQIAGVIEHQRGADQEAKTYFEKLLELDPNNAENYANLSTALSGLNEHEAALEYIEKAVAMDPKQPMFKNNLALMYRLLGRTDEAIKIMLGLLRDNDKAQFWDNLGSLYAEKEMYPESQKCLERAVKLDSGYIPAQSNLHLVYHFQGDWKKGFEQYEWRFFYKPDLQAYVQDYDIRKLWDGKADLNGKRVLIYGEQGYGDIIMFARYLKDIKARGAHVMLHCPPELNKLLEMVEGIDEFVNVDINKGVKVELPDYDYQFALLSAPHLLKVERITGEPYIKGVDDEFRTFLKEQTHGTFNVGVVWSGGDANPDNKWRSIPLEHFKALTGIPNVRLFSLQMGPHKDDKVEGLELVDLTGFLTDFGETARVLNALDLLICCDTSIAHVAGAMGFPVWDLVRYGPDWRWPQRESKTPWYDSMTQFHQTKNGGWDEVLGRVRVELEKKSQP
jgi:tetratricopeptide (TPR) repeat protein